jgi:polysaccharide deacetylase 2 family uncharacterized protein YibQ
MLPRHNALRLILSGLLLLGWLSSKADTSPTSTISIIIDDLGYQYKAGRRAINLNGKITYAFLPNAPYARRLAEQAYRQQKEIMLHLPMEAEAGNYLGSGALMQCMSEKEFKSLVHRNLAAIPHVRGFNNHMGSRLTKSPRLMGWLMQAAMFRDDLYFVDSRTTTESVAQQEAERRQIAATRRDIFLDYERNAKIVTRQLTELVRRAEQHGTALAIGHPYPETLTALEAWLPTLAQHGIKLVPVSELIHIRQQGRITPWQMSSYHSPRVVKNSKR